MKTLRMLALVLVPAIGAVHAATAQDPQRPVFRTRTRLVRVDAYPSRDGRNIDGLAAEDFEVFEDGVPQMVE